MGFQQEMERALRNTKEDLKQAAKQTWEVVHEGDAIIVQNELLGETVRVNDTVIAAHKRASVWSHIIPYVNLKGTYTGREGKTHRIHVRIGGFFALQVQIKVDGQLILQQKTKVTFLPWEHKEPLFPFIEAQVAAGVLTDALPDDRLLYEDGEPRLAPGLADQLVMQSVSPAYAAKLMKLLQAQLTKPLSATRQALYEKVLEGRVIDYLHMLVFEMQQTQFSQDALTKEAAWWLEHATHREALKFGIALFGFTDAHPYKERLQVVALHEEFTGVALFALQNGRALSNDFTFSLCKALPGWGKVAAIDFLQVETDEIRDWLLYEAVNTTLLQEQVVMYSIEKGKLDILLHEPTITAAQYDAANQLLRLVLESGQQERFDAYEYAGQVMQRFVYHAKQHAVTFEQFYTLTLIARYMDKQDFEWESLFETTWQPFQRNMVNDGIAEVAKRNWRPAAYELLQAGEGDVEAALFILHYYEEPIAPLLVQQLRKQPQHYIFYEMLMETKEQPMIREAAAIAATIPFAELDDDGEMSLLLLFEHLAHDEGAGVALFEHVLRSNEATLVYNALHAISHWSPQQRSALEEAIRAAEKATDVKEIRKLAKQLLQ